ncbi:hypothetical protein H5410_004639 [Solanum commersonii]|uniref:NAC domain-containing protein n=1 Tax=Solanum commersonii TaxID=4109 RepID=A0A9J6B8K6_SOLCO|nr:hypothetical protein H5410_004639 [Solanum commersonii]
MAGEEERVPSEEWKQQIPPGLKFCPSNEEILQYYIFRHVTGNYILYGIISQVDLYECNSYHLPEQEWKQQIPVGFKFCSTDEEILQYYLVSHVTENYTLPEIIHQFDLYKCNPYHLLGINMDGEYTYFFTKRDQKYVNGKNTARVTRDGKGYWKSTSKKTKVCAQDGSELGKKTTLKYHFKNSAGVKVDVPTEWIMHEYVISRKLVFPSISLDEDEYPHDTTMNSNYLCDSHAALILDSMRTNYEIDQTSSTNSSPSKIGQTSNTNPTPPETGQTPNSNSTLSEIGQTSYTNQTPLKIVQTSNTNSTPLEIGQTSNTNPTRLEIGPTSNTNATPLEIGQTSNTNSTQT